MCDNNITPPKNKMKHNFSTQFKYSELPFLENPFKEGCTSECINEYIEYIEQLRKSLNEHIKIIKSIKKFEDGSLPKYRFNDIVNYYQGDDEKIQNQYIQDFFNIDLLNLNIPLLNKREDYKSPQRVWYYHNIAEKFD